MCKKRNRLFHFNAPVFIFPLAVACHGGGVTAATFFKMASDAGINLQDYAREKNREIWNREETGATGATGAKGQSYQKSDILDNSLIINDSLKRALTAPVAPVAPLSTFQPPRRTLEQSASKPLSLKRLVKMSSADFSSVRNKSKEITDM